MKDKKLYEIIKATCKVWRAGGIIEYDEFVFCILKFERRNLEEQLENQIDMFNCYCPDDYMISKYDDAKFEKVGELWL